MYKPPSSRRCGIDSVVADMQSVTLAQPFDFGSRCAITLMVGKAKPISVR